MANTTIDGPAPAPGDAPDPVPQGPRRRRITVGRVLLGLGVLIVVLVVAGAAWWFLGRDEAEQRSTDSVVEDLRASGETASNDVGRPAFGVYAATATGTEDVGFPGLTESLGPNAPVTVTHGDGGCFTYRVDFNTHHWRTWRFCPGAGAAFALDQTESYTTRNLPGVDFGSSLNTFTCSTPVPYLWSDAVVGETRAGTCSGTSDTIPGVTTDGAVVEVLEHTTLTIGGNEVAVVHIRATDTFGDAQVGHETDEWWLDASTGLPVKVVIDSRMTSDSPVGSLDYVEKGTLELTTLDPTT